MNNSKRLPDAELEIMIAVWQSKCPVRTSEIQARLSSDWALGTVKALLGRLEERGYLKSEREGRIMLYSPIITQESYRKKETGGLLAKYYKNSAKSLVAALAMDEQLTQSDLDEITEMLNKARGNK